MVSGQVTITQLGPSDFTQNWEILVKKNPTQSSRFALTLGKF